MRARNHQYNNTSSTWTTNGRGHLSCCCCCSSSWTIFELDPVCCIILLLYVMRWMRCDAVWWLWLTSCLFIAYSTLILGLDLHYSLIRIGIALASPWCDLHARSYDQLWEYVHMYAVHCATRGLSVSRSVGKTLSRWSATQSHCNWVPHSLLLSAIAGDLCLKCNAKMMSLWSR